MSDDELINLVAAEVARHGDVIGRDSEDEWFVRCQCDGVRIDLPDPERVAAHIAAGGAVRRHAAEAVLAALAGRLLPPVVETREEWGVVAAEIQGKPINPPLVMHTCGDGPNCTTYFPWFHKPRTVKTLDDGSTLLGPWREVSP